MPSLPWSRRPGRRPVATSTEDGLDTGVLEGLARRRQRPRPARPVPEPGAPQHVVVCGDDPLALRVCEELSVRYGVRVTVIVPDREGHLGQDIAGLPGVEVVRSRRLDEAAFRAAGTPGAAAVALMRQDDVGNIHAALLAQEINPEVRLVVRMFNMSLGHGIRRLIGGCKVLSDADMAAPALVAAALGEVAPTYIRLPGRTLYVARRADVRPDEVVCGLADTSAEVADLLPAEAGRADLVLAVATGGRHRPATLEPSASPEERADAAAPSTAVQAVPASWWRRRRRPGGARRRHRSGPAAVARALVGSGLRIAALALVGLLVIGTVLLAAADRQLDLPHAAYVTILTALGGANADLTLPGWEQFAQTVLAVAGLALVPVVTAAVVDALIKARLATYGRLRGRISGHVVVVGLGNVGTRVIRTLHDLGVPVVAIDRAESARGTHLAETLGIPVIVGDASRAETLSAAWIGTSRALVVLSTDDVVNLETAINARTLNPALRVVLRLFDGEFAGRVQRAFDITTSRSVSYLAAPSFAAAVMERDVIGTIPVQRRVLVVAETPVGAGSPLDGATVGEAGAAGDSRVIAVWPRSQRDLLWGPRRSRRLEAGDRLIVVATREGLGGMLVQTSTPAGVHGGEAGTGAAGAGSGPAGVPGTAADGSSGAAGGADAVPGATPG